MAYSANRPSNGVTENLTSGDNQHPLEQFFGPYRGTHEQLRADDQLAHETYNLPKSYEGKNKFLEDIIDFKIRKQDEFYTSSLMPWEQTDQLHVAWEIFTFNKTLAELEPHQGIPRYVSAQSEAHSENLLRRGLAFIIEHGFYKTERGKRHFALNLQQIQNAVQTTCYFGVIHALLSGQNYYKEWNRKYGRQSNRVSELMAMERRRWAIAQKSKDGLYLLDAELKHELKREGITPNLYVFPDKFGIYVNMVGEHNLSYSERGPQANENRERGDQKASFRGTPVFEAQSFDVEFTGQPIDLMTRERQCGSWNYIEKGKEIAIYDADVDNWAVLKFSDLKDKCVNKGATKLDNGVNQRGATDQAKAGAQTVISGDDHDILVFRPHQTYNMASAILAKGGSELGSTYHGHHDFLLSDDIIRKVHVGHFTFYSKAVVKNPKNYIIVEDVFCRGYVGGEGSKPYKNADDYLNDRRGGRVGRDKSIIAVAVLKGTRKVLGPVLDITGRFHPSIYERFAGDDPSDSTLEHYPQSQFVYSALRLQESDPFRQTDEDPFINRVQRLNTVCFRGHQMEKDNGSWKVTQVNEGHWGPNVYPGCKKVRDGENSFLKDQDYKVDILG